MAEEPRPYEMTAVDTAHGDRAYRLLWPDGAPGALGGEAQDRPRITLYPASKENATGAAVVVCPGGGYHVLAADHEGKMVAEWLNSFGVSAYVLQYRLAPRYRHPAPLEDAQRAIRVVRSSAAQWSVDPHRIGILGFSAGGHLTATAGTQFVSGRQDAADPVDRVSSRPDFLILVYPVISFVEPFSHRGSAEGLLGKDADSEVLWSMSAENRVGVETPPTFLVHTTEDKLVPPENSLAFYSALRKAGVPAELHIFAKGDHGLGLGPAGSGIAQWPALCETWMRAMGLIQRP